MRCENVYSSSVQAVSLCKPLNCWHLLLQFDPEQFTMERLTRNTGSFKRRTTVTVQNQPHDEVRKASVESGITPASPSSDPQGQDTSHALTVEPAVAVQEVAFSETESTASPSEAYNRGRTAAPPSCWSKQFSHFWAAKLRDLLGHSSRRRKANPLARLLLPVQASVHVYVLHDQHCCFRYCCNCAPQTSSVTGAVCCRRAGVTGTVRRRQRLWQ